MFKSFSAVFLFMRFKVQLVSVRKIKFLKTGQILLSAVIGKLHSMSITSFYRGASGRAVDYFLSLHYQHVALRNKSFSGPRDVSSNPHLHNDAYWYCWRTSP